MNPNTLEDIIEKKIKSKFTEHNLLEEKLKKDPSSLTFTEVYPFLISDHEAIDLLDEDEVTLDYKIGKLGEIYSDFHGLIDEFKRKYHDHNTKNDNWHFFGDVADKEGKYKFKINRLKLKGINKTFEEPTIGFKYYLKVDLDTFLKKPEDVMNFYKELIEEAYTVKEAYRFKLARDFVDFITRRDGFILYLDKTKVDEFERRVEHKLKKYQLGKDEVRGELGFDITLPTGVMYSYTQLKAMKLIGASKKARMTPYEMYDCLNGKIPIDARKLYQLYKSRVKPFED